MTSPLHFLTRKIARERMLDLTDTVDQLGVRMYARTGPFSISYFEALGIEALNVQKEAEMGISMLAFQGPLALVASKDRYGTITVVSGCLHDYLRQLSLHANSVYQFVLKAEYWMENSRYLRDLVTGNLELEQTFEEPEYLGFLSLCDAFFPKGERY